MTPVNDEEASFRWQDFVGLEARFQRSVHLERDAEVDDCLSGYLLTPLGRRLLGRMTAGLQAANPTRAWSITGPFGSGKSAFAVFAAQALGPDRLKESRIAREILREADPGLYEKISQLGGGGPDLVPVLATGDQRPLEAILISALCRAVKAQWKRKPKFFKTLQQMEEQARRGERLSTKDVVNIFTEAAAKVAASRRPGRGLFIVLDEAGKALEYAANSPSSGDVLLLQELAEAANRSGAAPMVFVVILHQAFEQYASRLTASRRSEWSKVQGRFEDIVFREENDQIIRLIGRALNVNSPSDSLTESYRAISCKVADAIPEIEDGQRHELKELLSDCMPLHPATALVLGPLFRGGLGQNERSLFAFLSAMEPAGLQEFIRAARCFDADDIYFGVDMIYDYVDEALRGKLHGHHGRQWGLVRDGLLRLPKGANAYDAKLLKMIGVLGAIAESAGLAPSEELLIACCTEGESVARKVRDALKRLKAASLVVYRKYKGCYQVFEGSDLDIDKLVEEASRRLSAEKLDVRKLTAICPPRPLVARRHMFETGTLRYFDVVYVDETILDDSPVRGSLNRKADGHVLVAIPSSPDAAQALDRGLRNPLLLENLDGRPVVCALPKNVEKIRQSAIELAALQEIQIEVRELKADNVASREVATRINEAQAELHNQLERLTKGSGNCEWLCRGETREVSGVRGLTGVISEICDQVYSDAPKIHNELLNRSSLSSSAAAARRNLIERIIESSHAFRCGIEGAPPELSMYLAVFKELGLHSETEQGWRLTPPSQDSKENGMAKAWTHLRATLSAGNGRKLPAKAVADALTAPPIGIKEGLVPVIVITYLLVQGDEVALYEDEVFVPVLTTAVAERFLKNAARFELQHYEMSGVREQAFEGLVDKLFKPGHDKRQGMLTVVKQLVRTVTSLPTYSQNTSAVSPTAQGVREAILRAREPGRLMFSDLPKACGMPAFGPSEEADRADADKFGEKIREAIKELKNAYAQLLDDIESRLSSSFGVKGDAQTVRSDIAGRCGRISDYAVEPTLKSFVIRAKDSVLAREEWLVSVATLLGGKPPDRWSDADFEQAKLNFDLLMAKFQAVEALAISTSASEQVDLLRISVTEAGESERSRIVSVAKEDREELERFCGRMRRDLIEPSCVELAKETILAGLARVSNELIKELETENNPLNKADEKDSHEQKR